MNKRLVWLAPIALAVLLTGCSITVRVMDLAPDSLLEKSIVFTNRVQSGFFPDGHGTYHFNSEGTALDANLIPARTWSYKPESGRNATLSLTFRPPDFSDLTVNCDLSFTSDYTGEHQCQYTLRTSTAMVDVTVKGSSKGTFQLEEL